MKLTPRIMAGLQDTTTLAEPQDSTATAEPQDTNVNTEIQDMTGFGKAQGFVRDDIKVNWKINSLNSKGITFQRALPVDYTSLTAQVCNMILQNFNRGAFTIKLKVNIPRSFRQQLKVLDNAFIEDKWTTAKALSEKLGTTPPTMDAILALPGSLREVDVQDDSLVKDIKENVISVLKEAVEDLKKSRV